MMLLLAASGLSAFADWVKIAEGASASLYADKSSVRRNKSGDDTCATVWKKSGDYALARGRYCSPSKTVQILALTQYGGNGTLKESAPFETAVQDIRPGSLGKAIYDWLFNGRKETE